MTTTKKLDPADAVIRKKTSSLGDLIIRIIDKPTAREMIIKRHYSHTWNDGNFGLYNFGIFRAEDPDNLLGVASYGYVKNSKADLWSHDVPGGWVIELNRMWIDDCLGKNAETVLIGASIRLLRRLDPTIVAVQSFADGRLGCGTIYKAANFNYFGRHKTIFLRDRRNGGIKHEQNLSNSCNPGTFLRNNIELFMGNLRPFEVWTYRYIYPLHKSFRVKKLCQQPPPAYSRGELPSSKMWNAKTRIALICRLLTKLAARNQYFHTGDTGGGGGYIVEAA